MSRILDLRDCRIPTGGELRIYRKSLGLSQREVSEKIGFTQTALSKWENENTHPNSKKLRELLSFYRLEAIKQGKEINP